MEALGTAEPTAGAIGRAAGGAGDGLAGTVGAIGGREEALRGGTPGGCDPGRSSRITRALVNSVSLFACTAMMRSRSRSSGSFPSDICSAAIAAAYSSNLAPVAAVGGEPAASSHALAEPVASADPDEELAAPVAAAEPAAPVAAEAPAWAPLAARDCDRVLERGRGVQVLPQPCFP